MDWVDRGGFKLSGFSGRSFMVVFAQDSFHLLGAMICGVKMSMLTCGWPPRAMRFKFTLNLVAYRATIGQYGLCLDGVS